MVIAAEPIQIYHIILINLIVQGHIEIIEVIKQIRLFLTQPRAVYLVHIRNTARNYR